MWSLIQPAAPCRANLEILLSLLTECLRFSCFSAHHFPYTVFNSSLPPFPGGCSLQVLTAGCEMLLDLPPDQTRSFHLTSSA